MLLGTLGASVLRNVLTVKGVLRPGKCAVRAGRVYNNINHVDKHF